MAGSSSDSCPISTVSACRSIAGRLPVDDDDRARRQRMARGTTLAAGNTDNDEPAAMQHDRTRSAAEQRRVDDVGHQRLAERDRVALQPDAHDPRSTQARRIGLAGTHPVERLRHRPAVVARPAPRPPHGAVHLDDLAGFVAGSLVELVDVLRDDRDAAVPGVRDRRSPGDRRWAARPTPVSVSRFCHAKRRTSGSAR